ARPDRGRLPDGVVGRRLHHESDARGRHRRTSVDRIRIRCPAAGARAWRSGSVAGATPVLLEERQMGTRPDAHTGRRAGVLGDIRLPQPRRPMARAAVPGRLIWQLGRVRELVDETPRTKSIALE